MHTGAARQSTARSAFIMMPICCPLIALSLGQPSNSLWQAQGSFGQHHASVSRVQGQVLRSMVTKGCGTACVWVQYAIW